MKLILRVGTFILLTRDPGVTLKFVKKQQKQSNPQRSRLFINSVCPNTRDLSCALPPAKNLNHRIIFGGCLLPVGQVHARVTRRYPPPQTSLTRQGRGEPKTWGSTRVLVRRLFSCSSVCQLSFTSINGPSTRGNACSHMSAEHVGHNACVDAVIPHCFLFRQTL